MKVESRVYIDLVAEYRNLLSQGFIVYQQCAECGNNNVLPRTICRSCHSIRLTWVATSGLGVIYSFSIVHRAPDSSWINRVPYAIGLIDLENGVRTMGHIEISGKPIACGGTVKGSVRELYGIPLLYFTGS